MAFLSTSDLAEIVIQTLPSVVAEGSALTAAGVRNISYNTTDIRKISVAGPSLVAEGGVKPVNNPQWEMEKVKPGKLVQAMVVSEEFEDSAEGRALAAAAIGEYLATFPAGMDVTVLNGTNPADGTALDYLADTNLKDNATQITSSDPAAFDSVLSSAIFGVESAEHTLLSRDGFSQLAQLRTAQNGLMKYPNANRKGTFDFSTVDTDVFKSVGLNGWTPADIKNTNLAIVGDFSKIGVAFQAPTVRIGREGTIGSDNLLAENKIAYIIEQKFRFYIDEPESFSVVKTEA